MNVYKRFKRIFTVIEQLPNEIFIEIFSYLSDVDVVYSFSQLNTRFQSLLFHCCHSFDFKSASKTKFDLVIQQHDKWHWRSLRLSNDDETPGQIEIFCRECPLDKYLGQLESISLVKMKPTNDNLFLSQFRSFTHLISLTIKSICGKCIYSMDLPSLKQLIVHSCMYGDWMMDFPRLEILEHTIEEHPHHDWPRNTNDQYDLIWPRTVKRLKVDFDEKKYGIYVRKLIRQLYILISLEICVENDSGSAPNGRIWEDLINSSLSSLQTFNFYFSFKLPADIDTVIATFSTPFYLFEKCWFIRCDTSSQTTSACLYSLPFVFKYFSIHTYTFDTSITTLLNDDNADKNMYKNVKTLIFNYVCNEPHPTFRPNNIDKLVLHVSFLPSTWLPILTRLRHLSLGPQVTMASSSFARLLETTSKLYYLTTEIDTLKDLTDNWSNLVVCNLLSDKIQRLDLDPRKDLYSKSKVYIKSKDLQNVVHIFGTNCENLTIYLESHHIIESFIIPYMQKLRSLNVSGIFNRFGRTFVMNSVEQWQRPVNNSCYISANWNGFQVWFENRQ